MLQAIFQPTHATAPAAPRPVSQPTGPAPHPMPPRPVAYPTKPQFPAGKPTKVVHPHPLPRPHVPTPAPSLCPRGSTPTSAGCVWPPGTVAAFSKKRNKWRIAVPLSALPDLPVHGSHAHPKAAPSGGGAFGLYGTQGYGQSFGFGFATLSGPSHAVVAETDQPPAGVQQVDETQLDSMTGEPTSSAPAPAPAPAPAAASAPAPAPAPAAPAPAASTAPASASASTSPSTYTQETEASPTEGRYKGCIARFNKTRKVFSIYCPVGSQAAQPGLGIIDGEYFRCLYSNCGGLGADDVTPPPPPGLVKTAEVSTLPRAGETTAGDERDKFFRLKNPLMWAAIAGVAAAAGGGGYMLYRRRRGA